MPDALQLRLCRVEIVAKRLLGVKNRDQTGRRDIAGLDVGRVVNAADHTAFTKSPSSREDCRRMIRRDFGENERVEPANRRMGRTDSCRFAKILASGMCKRVRRL